MPIHRKTLPLETHGYAERGRGEGKSINNVKSIFDTKYALEFYDRKESQ